MKRKSKLSAAKPEGDVITSPDNAASHPESDTQRCGPRPLNMHLYTTAFLMSAAAWPWANKPEHREQVLNILGTLGNDMKRGIEDYKAMRLSANRAQQTLIWQEGSTRLTRFPGKNKTPVLLVPSLINKPDVLDLDADYSFTRFLDGQGYDVYTLDWGAPDQEKTFTINDYITKRLLPALKTLQQKTGMPAHVIGYCMGGTVAAGAISVLKDQAKLVKSLTMLAAPWDFQASDSAMSLRMNAFLLSAQAVMDAKQVLPVDWIQMLFASIDPLFAFNKFRVFADMNKDSEEARRFVIVEDWLNDGVDLAAPAARQALQEWYIDNQPVNGVWTIGPDLVDTANIKVPVLAVSAGGDRLVPKPSADAFMQHAEGVTRIDPSVGHIGMMASNRAPAEVWQPIADFLSRH